MKVTPTWRVALLTVAVFAAVGIGVDAAFHYVARTFNSVLAAESESLRVQGEIIAAVIGANAATATQQRAVSSDRPLGRQDDRTPTGAASFRQHELSIDPVQVAPILMRLLATRETRARVYAKDGALILDSSPASWGPAWWVEAEREGSVDIKAAGMGLIAWLARDDLQVYRDVSGSDGWAYPELRRALSGINTTMLLINEKGQEMIGVAVPIAFGNSAQGVLLLSRRVWT
jgi:two-component system sensor histidine kinase ChvG